MTYTVGICQDCNIPLSYDLVQKGTLFCSDRCKQEADLVRYGRATTRDGRYKNDPKVRLAFATRLSFVVQSGYAEKERYLSHEQRTAILERDHYSCRMCGKPGNTIDHISGSSNGPSNLQVLCWECHMSKTWSHPVPMTQEQRIITLHVWERIKADTPMKLCDDEKQWKTIWRELSTQQKHMEQWRCEFCHSLLVCDAEDTDAWHKLATRDDVIIQSQEDLEEFDPDGTTLKIGSTLCFYNDECIECHEDSLGDDFTEYTDQGTPIFE